MRLILISLLIHAATSSCPIPVDESQPSTREDELPDRLPRNVQPNRYHITLHPDLSPGLDPATFTGSVRIEFTALENTSNITLKIRALDIDVASVRVSDSNNNTLEITDSITEISLEFFIINLENELVQGNDYVVSIEKFEGILNLLNAGLYLAKYWDEDGTERRFATTQFESTNARRAFPSFDEPEWKATFVTKLRRTADYISISNENIESSLPITVDGAQIIEDTYKETVKMSTYLNAFIITQFDFTEDVQGRQRVYARPEYVRDGWVEYALRVGVETISALDAFTGIPYSYAMDKLDQIAIPDDYFSPGAMENWGLVTYRESYLLYDESISTTTQQQRQTTVIAHELGHQWFGNLVTMSWWKYLWLNEGFATYFEFYAASVVQPTWRLMEQLALELQYALEYDSLEATQPMNYETSTGGSGPSYISYEKAGSVIRMAENFLTTEVFKRGLTVYLQNKEFDVAEPDDLYDGWQEALVSEGKQNLLPPTTTVNSILGPWADQKGYPVVTLTRNYENNQINASQRRFTLNGLPEGDDPDVLWPVPLNIFYSTAAGADFSDTTANSWLLTQSLLIQPSADYQFVIANKKQTGYYRVNYDDSNWNAIIEALQTDDITKIDPLNRAQLLDDAFHFARAGLQPYTLPFSLSTYLKRETDYLPLTSFFNAVRYLHPILASREGYGEFKTFVGTLLETVAQTLTFEAKPEDEHVDKLNRVNVMNWLCDLDLADCRQSALTRFRAWRSNANDPIPPNGQLYTYCAALRAGDQSDLDFLFEKYQTEKLDLIRTRILNVLGCSGDEAVLTRLLSSTLDPLVEFYKPADRQTAFASVYNSGSFGLNVAFEFVKNNFTVISASTLNLNTIITGLSTRFSSEQQLTELSALLVLLEAVVPEATRDTARRNTQENVNFANVNVPGIVQFLEQYNELPAEESTAGSSTTEEILTITPVPTTAEDILITTPAPTTAEDILTTTPAPTTEEDVLTTTPDQTTDEDTTTPAPTNSGGTDSTTDSNVETTTQGSAVIASSLALLVLGYLSSLLVK